MSIKAYAWFSWIWWHFLPLRSVSHKNDGKNIVALHKLMHTIDECFGCLDMTKVPWPPCPSVWKGKFEDKEVHLTIGLEAVVDYILLTRHSAFGFSVALNHKKHLGSHSSLWVNGWWNTGQHWFSQFMQIFMCWWYISIVISISGDNQWKFIQSNFQMTRHNQI
jgi:hypothetical protein